MHECWLLAELPRITLGVTGLTAGHRAMMLWEEVLETAASDPLLLEGQMLMQY